MDIVLPIVGFFLLGVAVRRWLGEQQHWVNWVNQFIIYVSFPAIILNKVPALAITSKVFIPAAIAWGWAGFAIVSVLLVARAIKLPRETTGAMLILATMGNTAFLGFALTQSIFGDAALGYAIFYDQFGSFFILSTIGIILIARYAPSASANNASSGLSDMLKRILSFPPFLVLCVALLLPVEGVLEPVTPMLAIFGSLLVPLALFVIGLQFQARLLAHHRLPLLLVIALKMVIAPILVFIFFELINTDKEIRIASIFLASMPSMITPGLLAMHAGIAPRFIAATLGYGALFSFVTLPIVVWVLL